MEAKCLWICSRRVSFSFVIFGGMGWFVTRTRCKAKILHFGRKQLFSCYPDLASGESLHFLAECGNVPTSLDDALTAVMVLIEFVAEVLKD